MPFARLLRGIEPGARVLYLDHQVAVRLGRPDLDPRPAPCRAAFERASDRIRYMAIFTASGATSGMPMMSTVGGVPARRACSATARWTISAGLAPSSSGVRRPGRDRAHVGQRLVHGAAHRAQVRIVGAAGVEPSLDRVQPEHGEGKALARPVVQVGADPAALQLGQGRGPRGGLADPVAQPRVLVEQGRELVDSIAELVLLAEDRLAALAHDADEGQVREDRRSRDQAPRDQAVAVDLGLELVGELVELGDRDDPRRAARADRQVELDQVAPALSLVDVLGVAQVADVADDRAGRRLTPLPAHVEALADQLAEAGCTGRDRRSTRPGTRPRPGRGANR